VSLTDRLVVTVNEVVFPLGGPACRVGVADTPFAARLAARSGRIIPAGQTAEWLADLPIEVLGPADLTDLLRRLGIRRVGDFAGLDEGVVGARFGSEGALAHRFARAFDDHSLALSDPPPDLTVTRELDDPVDQVDTVAFVAAGLAEELVQRLAPHGLACTRLLVAASTEHAEELSRWWRADRPFTARAMVDRVRWQLEGWLASPECPPSAGITQIRLTAGEVVADSGRQLGLFGGPVEASQRVERGIARIQGLLGHEAVVTAVRTGGRSPAEQVRLVPWGDPREESDDVRHPWPGRVPAPSPALVHTEPAPVTVVDAGGDPVTVTGRGRCSTAPEQVLGRRGVGSGSGPGRWIVGWAGPWPADERWWDPGVHRRRARLQVLLDDGSAHLLVVEGGAWSIEATYD
jgi:protein ImuB